ncbi:MAG: LPS assembly protein LptD [Candidatus Scalinduaceae bacterium]
MRLFASTIFFTSLILCNNALSQGPLITKDNSKQPISITARRISTWDENGFKVFMARGNVKIEQGNVLITANSLISWFREVKIAQFAEGQMEIYCEGKISLLQEEIVQNYEQMYLRLVTTAGVVVNPIKTKIQKLEEERKTKLYLRGELIRAEGLGEFASEEIPRGPRIRPPTSLTAEGKPIDIFADDIDTWVEKDVRIIVATGNVMIKGREETLNADNVILYFDIEKGGKDKPLKQIYKELYAEGNVTMRRKKDLMIAEKIFENIKENEGIFVKSVFSSTFKTPYSAVETPVYIHGDEIKHKGKGLYEVKNGSFTSCSYGHPHFRFQSSKVRIFKTADHSIVSAKKNVFYAGNIPVAYLPFLNFDMKRKKRKLLKNWEFGRISRFGRFFKTDWDIYSIAFGEKMGDWSDLTFSADFLELRGPAVGLDFLYEKANFSGLINTYYVRDEKDTDINNVPITSKDRGQFLWRHRQLLANNWIADIEVSNVSDRNFFREYFRNVFKVEKDRETIFYLRKASDNRGFSFLAEKQLRTYDTLVNSQRLNRTNQTLPELKYSIIGEPLWEGKLNFSSETELAYHDRVFDEISPKRAEEQFLGRGALLTAERVFDRVPVRLEPEETIRFDTDNTINAPFRILGIKFNPFMGVRLTGYSESVKVDPVTLRNKGGGTPRGRIAGSLGLDIGTTLSRTYSVYNKLLNINRLRHIIVPEVRFNFMPLVTQNPEDLNQFDGIDALDDYQSIKLGLRNRLQTKRGKPGKEKSVDFIDFDMGFNIFPGNAGLNRKRDDFFGLDLRIKLTDKISLLSERNEFNLRKGGVDVLNIRLRYNPMPGYRFSIGHRFIDDTSSTVRFSSTFSLSEKWRVVFSENFDFRAKQRIGTGQNIRAESQNLSSVFVLSRFFHDMIGNLTINKNEITGDTIARFDIIPRGVGSVGKRLQTVGALVPQSSK